MGGCYGLRSMPMAPAEWLAAYRTAWLQRDADAAAALFTEDATYAEQPYQDAFAGPAAVREYWARVTATQSNIEMRYGTPITVGNRTAVEWWTTLVNDGAPITLAGAFILTFDASGRCRSLREYLAVHRRHTRAEARLGELRGQATAGWVTYRAEYFNARSLREILKSIKNSRSVGHATA